MRERCFLGLPLSSTFEYDISQNYTKCVTRTFSLIFLIIITFLLFATTITTLFNNNFDIVFLITT